MIKFLSREGVSFRYRGDVVTRRWPWIKAARYSSSLHSCDFNNFSEYWQRLGSMDAALQASTTRNKVIGLRMHEVLCEYAKLKFPGELLAVLCDINPHGRDSTFWNRLPKHQAEQLAKDVAIFRCKDRTQMLDITVGTPPGFATVYAIENGMLVDCNLWSD